MPGSSSFEDLMADVRERTSAARVTLRLDVAGANFPVIAEALDDGAASIRSDNSLDQRGAATAQRVMRTRQVLVQNDCLKAENSPPAALLEAYRVRAQVLAPVLIEGAVAGWVSVHSMVERAWSDHDVAAASRAADAAAAALQSTVPRGQALAASAQPLTNKTCREEIPNV
jgi:maleate isomerase